MEPIPRGELIKTSREKEEKGGKVAERKKRNVMSIVILSSFPKLSQASLLAKRNGASPGK